MSATTPWKPESAINYPLMSLNFIEDMQKRDTLLTGLWLAVWRIAREAKR